MARSKKTKAVVAVLGAGSVAAVGGALAAAPAPAPDKAADAGVAPAVVAPAVDKATDSAATSEAKQKDVKKVKTGKPRPSEFDADLAMPAGTLYDVISRRSIG